MEFISQMAGLWNEFLLIGIGSGMLGCVLTVIVTLLVEKLKLISSMVVAIPTAICLGITKITIHIAIFLGIVQLALKLL